MPLGRAFEAFRSCVVVMVIFSHYRSQRCVLAKYRISIEGQKQEKNWQQEQKGIVRKVHGVQAGTN